MNNMTKSKRNQNDFEKKALDFIDLIRKHLK
jgi:hypothetical protein